MPEDEALNFIAQVHETLAKADTLIEQMQITYEVLEDVPGVPEESLTFIIDNINTMTTLKVLVKHLLEHSANMNDEMDKFVKELEKRLKK